MVKSWYFGRYAVNAAGHGVAGEASDARWRPGRRRPENLRPCPSRATEIMVARQRGRMVGAGPGSATGSQGHVTDRPGELRPGDAGARYGIGNRRLQRVPADQVVH